MCFGVMGSATVLAQDVGEVMSVIGGAKVYRGNNNLAQSVKKGMKVAEGDSIETPDGAYVYLTMQDQTFISLRPQSKITIEAYRIQNQQVQDVRIKLHKGVMRQVSGQVAKDKYRLNTPVAAIGIRGTDFSVYTNHLETRATVRSGGIVMSPFGEGCAVLGSGPCEGRQTSELFARDAHRMLQLRQGDPKAEYLDGQFRSLQPDHVAPPRSDELSKSGVKSSTGGESSTDAKAVSAQAMVSPAIPAEVRVVEQLNTNDGINTARLYWGRWAGFVTANGDAYASANPRDIMPAGASIIAINDTFLIGRDATANVQLPTRGSFNFSLQNAQAFLLTNNGSPIALGVNDATLAINFANNTFQTGMRLSGPSRDWQVSTAGTVSPSGLMSSDYLSGNMAVRGAVGGAKATEATYLFNSRLDELRLITGAAAWAR